MLDELRLEGIIRMIGRRAHDKITYFDCDLRWQCSDDVAALQGSAHNPPDETSAGGPTATQTYVSESSLLHVLARYVWSVKG